MGTRNISKYDYNFTRYLNADLEYFPEDIIEMFEVSKKFPNSLILGSKL